MLPKSDAKERVLFELEEELMPEPVNDVEAFLNCARYNDEDDAQLLREYLQKHPQDIDARDAQGRTAVHMAAANGHMAILNMLIEFAPTPDVKNEEGNTALHFAALNNRVEAARRLIEAGWKASAMNSFRRTPFQLIQGKRFEEMDALLLEHDDSLDVYEPAVQSSADTPNSDEKKDGGGEKGDGDGEGRARQKATAPRVAPTKGTAKSLAGRAPNGVGNRKPKEAVFGSTGLDSVE